jgi:hypothetical protein
VTFSEPPSGTPCQINCGGAGCVNINGYTAVVQVDAHSSLALLVVCQAPCVPAPYTVTGTLTSSIDNSPSNNVASVAIAFSAPLKITATASTTQLACKGDVTTLVATVSGGSANFQYSLDKSVSVQSTNEFLVGAGDHTISVSDGKGCKATSNVVTIVEPLTAVSDEQSKQSLKEIVCQYAKYSRSLCVVGRICRFQ